MPETILPERVVARFTIQPSSLRKFISPYHEAVCGNCTWVSYLYPTKAKAEEVALLHVEQCCARINEELALMVPTQVVPVQELTVAHAILTKNLRVLEVLCIVEELGGDVHVVYLTDDLEGTNVITLPRDHPVKVVA
jgi:hypothetical protein